MVAAKVMDIISRLLGCDGETADAVFAKTQVKMEDAPKLLKIPKSECPDIWIRLPRQKWPVQSEDPVVPLLRKKEVEKGLWEHGGEKKIEIGNVHSWIEKKDYSYLCMWSTKKWLGRNRSSTDCRKYQKKDVDLGKPTSFPDHVYLGCTQRECQTNKDIVDKYRNRFESKIFAGAAEELPNSEKLTQTFLHCFKMESHEKKCVERYCEQTRKNNPAIAQSYNSMHGCSIWHELGDLIFYCQ